MSSTSTTNKSSVTLRQKWLLPVGVLMLCYGFGWLTESVWNRNGLHCDIPALDFIHQFATHGRDTLMIWTTRAGSVKFIVFLTMLTAFAWALTKKWRDAAFLLVTVGGALALDWAFKNGLHRIRPHLWESPAPEFDFSFPSGHSTGTMSFIAALVVILWKTRWRWVILFGGAFYIVAVGFSRLYLGVHYPSDVVGGWLLALAWVSGIIGLRGLAQPNRFKIGLRFFGGVAAGLILALAGYISSDLIHDNLRVVAAGQAYRSGQMDAEGFTSVIEHYGIKSILNLRGENPTTSWHQAEIATAAKLNVVHYDRSLGSGTRLTLAQMDDLVTLLRQAPKPVLIHCNGGADRSALVAALYDFAIRGQPPAEANKEFSVWNGHVPFLRPKVTAMDDSFWRYVSNDTDQIKLKTSSVK
jgi:undecaprenyl-diphosphatase